MPRWRRTGVALLAVGAGAMGLIAVTPLGAAFAETPAQARVQTLKQMVQQARARELSLQRQVQAVKARLTKERTEIATGRAQLAALISAEYTGAASGVLAVIGSSSLSSALDTQIAFSRLSSAEQDAIQRLRTETTAETRDSARLAAEQRQTRVTAARLQAEEIAAAFVAANPPPPPSPKPTPAEQATTPAPAATPTSTPGSRPTVAPTPTPSPTPTPTPAPATGPFSVNTNLTQPSGIDLNQIQEFLQGTPLEADSAYFLSAQSTHHVSAIYLVSDAVLETGFGTSQLYLVKHNLFGFQAYDANPFGDGAAFPSDQTCISFVSWYVSVYYLTPPGSQVPNYPGQAGTVATGKFYNGPTPEGMNVDYASDPQWASKIASIGDSLQQMPA